MDKRIPHRISAMFFLTNYNNGKGWIQRVG